MRLYVPPHCIEMLLFWAPIMTRCIAREKTSRSLALITLLYHPRLGPIDTFGVHGIPYLSLRMLVIIVRLYYSLLLFSLL